MGADFQYAGSISYPRLNDEMKKVVKIFGGVMTTKRKPSNECTMTEYFMEEPLKYSFNKPVLSLFEKWCNNPFKRYTKVQVEELYEFMKRKWRKVKKASPQIAYELEQCYIHDDHWQLY